MSEQITSDVAQIIKEGAYTPDSRGQTVHENVLAREIHKHYFEEEAEKVGRLIDNGWIPPEEAKHYVRRDAIRAEIERVGEVEIDPHNYTNPTAIKIGIAIQQAHILKILEEAQ